MQKKAIRIITKLKSNAPPFPLLPLEHLITLTGVQLIHSIFHKYAPKAIHNLKITNKQRGINPVLQIRIYYYAAPDPDPGSNKCPYGSNLDPDPRG